MGHYRYKKADGWAHTSDIADNFKGVDFYKGKSIGNQILAETAISMKTTKAKYVRQWLNSADIKKNIAFLKDGLNKLKGIDSNKHKMFINNAEVHVYIPKENISKDLLDNWNKELSKITKDTNIKFEIKSLEEFIE